MDQEMKERIVQIIKEKHRINNVYREDLLKFIQDNIESSVDTKEYYNTLVEIAEEYLTVDTLEQFYGLKRFGLAKGDLNFVLNASEKTVNELTKTKQIELLDTIISSKGRVTITTYVYSVPDALRLEEEGKIKHKRKINRTIREFEETDENIAEALYVINKSAKVSRDTKNESYFKGNHGVCHAQKTRENTLYSLKDAVVKKLLNQERLEYIGFNKQFSNYLKLYKLGKFTFHVPVYFSKEDYELEEEYKLEDIDDMISSEKKIKTNINYNEAIHLLEEYVGKTLNAFKPVPCYGYWY